ncbi:MAG: SulP family inorganic anion transporter, partial [Caldilineaceae bacterium]
RIRFNRADLTIDLIAGLTFAIVNIPQAMANALLASVNPVYGLRTLILATPVAALSTGAVYMNVSTTSALSLATADALFGIKEQSVPINLTLLVLMVGAIQIVAGILKLGSLVRFVAKSVMVGFTTGIALLIVMGQLDGLTGYSSHFRGSLLKFADTVLSWQDYDLATLGIGLLTIGIILLLNHTRIRKVSLAVALVVATIVNWVLSLPGVELVGQTVSTSGATTGNIFSGDWQISPYIFSGAVAIAIIGLIQGAGVSQSYPNPDGKYPNVSRDFFGQGLANVVASLWQGIPAGGSMSGTSLVVSSGQRTRLANVFAGLLILPLVFVFSTFIKQVPMTTLSALLIVVGVQSLQPEQVRTIWFTGPIPRMSFGITLIATLTLPLQYAVFIGVAVSFLLYVFRASNQVSVSRLTMVPNGYPIEVDVPKTLGDDDTVVLQLYGSLFFASAAKLEERLPDPATGHGTVVILRLRGRDEIGSTLIGLLQRYADSLKSTGNRMILCGVSEPVFEQMRRTGLVRSLGEGGVHIEQPQLGASLNAALTVAERWHAKGAPAS